MADLRPEPDASHKPGVALKRKFFAAALAGGALMSFEARGQIAPKSVQFGVAAGAAIPTSDLSNAFNTGFNVTGVLGFQPDMILLGGRGDVAHNQVGRQGPGANAPFT